MHFERLELRDFRLYSRVDVAFEPGLNVLVGPNAAGKTSVLEALSLLATGRSFRGAADADMVRTGGRAYRVRGRVTGTLSSHVIEVSFLSREDGPSRRELSVDGRRLARPGEMLGRVPVVSFRPDDLTLVKGGPAERRRFLDTLCGQTQPSYREALMRYHRNLTQRNALLSDIAGRRLSAASSRRLLEPWDEALIEEAARVQSARAAVLRALREPAAEAFREVAVGLLEITYAPDRFDPGRLEEELLRQVTLSGPHRDEVVLTVDGRDARRFASQGQQRSAVLALKLASLGLLEEKARERPILLLDDVMSELDPRRRASLLPLLGRGQAFVTTTDRLGLERTLTEGDLCGNVVAWFTVAEGAVRREGSP